MTKEEWCVVKDVLCAAICHTYTAHELVSYPSWAVRFLVLNNLLLEKVTNHKTVTEKGFKLFKEGPEILMIDPDYAFYGNLDPIWQITCVVCQTIDQTSLRYSRREIEAYFRDEQSWHKSGDGKWICKHCWEERKGVR